MSSQPVAIIFPINTLPEELLSIIFRFVTPHGDARGLYHVCLTCRQWYRIASKIIVSSLGNGNIRSCLRHLLNNPTLRSSVSRVDAVVNLRPGGDMRVYGLGGSGSVVTPLSDADLAKLKAEVLGLSEVVRNEYSFQKSRLSTTTTMTTPTYDKSRSYVDGDDEDDSEDLSTRVQTRRVKKLRREGKLQKRLAVQKMVSEICLGSTDAMFTMILHWAVNLESLEVSGDMSERSGSMLRLVKHVADERLAASRAWAAAARVPRDEALHNSSGGGDRRVLGNLRSVTLMRIRGIFAAPFFFLPNIRNVHLLGIDLDNPGWREQHPKSYGSLKGRSPVRQLFLENISYESSSLLGAVRLCEKLESLLICFTDGTTTTAGKADVLADCVQAQKGSLVEIGIVDDRRYIPEVKEEEEDMVAHENTVGHNDGPANGDDDSIDDEAQAVNYDLDDEQMPDIDNLPSGEDAPETPQSEHSGLQGYGFPELRPLNIFPASAKIDLRRAMLECAGQLKRFTLQLRGSDTLSWSSDDGVGSVADLRDILGRLMACEED